MQDPITEKMIELSDDALNKTLICLEREIFPLLPKTNKRQKELLKQKLYAYTKFVSTEFLKIGWDGGIEEGKRNPK